MVSDEMACASDSCAGKRYCSAACYWETHVGSSARHSPPKHEWAAQWWQTPTIMAANASQQYYDIWVVGVERKMQADAISELEFALSMF